MEEGHGKTPYALTPEQYSSFLIRLFRLWYKDLRKGCQRSRDLHPETGLYTNYFCKGYRMFFDACSDTIRKIAAQLPQR